MPGVRQADLPVIHSGREALAALRASALDTETSRVTDDAREQRRRRKAELAMRAYAERGNPKAAADHLGISVRTLHERVADYCALMGYDSPIQAAFELGK
jgi:transcriptional regulator with PAS, ATPase and Fis domain